jgi:para-nitrobenzyl esterase
VFLPSKRYTLLKQVPGSYRARFPSSLLASALLSMSVLPASLSAATADPNTATIVQTASGTIRGAVDQGVVSFKGIPYAAPPVGERRWALPSPAAKWQGVLDATQYRNGCPQVARYGLTEAGYNEDCLFLNVTVPLDGKPAGTRRPVFVWIYGGAFVGGSSALYPLKDLALAGDAVVVSFNYRLGVFGFMAHPGFGKESNGVYGLEDQREALRWVKKNIAAFGGDANNVTIAGESAGAASACMHLIAPKETAGLFQKAIMQSAGCTQHLRTTEEAGSVGIKVAKVVGCPVGAGALDCMRKRPVKMLVEAAAQVAGSDVMAYAPSIGTPVIPMQGLEAMQTGQFVHVPIINGGNKKELLLYVAYDVEAGKPVTPENYAAHLKAVYGSNAQQVEARYPLSKYDSAPVALGTAMSDFTPINGLNNCLFLQTARYSSTYAPAYEYGFEDKAAPPPIAKAPDFPMGAVHSAELPYQFRNFSNTTKVDAPDLAPASAALGKQMVQLWMSFASTGKPTAEGVPPWPAYHDATDVLRLDPGNVSLFNASEEHQCHFWQGLYPTLLPK